MLRRPACSSFPRSCPPQAALFPGAGRFAACRPGGSGEERMPTIADGPDGARAHRTLSRRRIVSSNSATSSSKTSRDRAHRVHPPDDLPDRHRDHVGIVGGGDPLVRLADQQVLQRHRQRLRRAGLGPGVGPPRLEQPGRLAAVDARPDGWSEPAPRPAHAARRRRCRGAYSGVVSQYEPIHTPVAPSASAAAICRPEPMPPAASTGASAADRVHDLRHQHHRRDLAGVAACLVPCATTMSTPLSTCARGVLRLAGQRRDRHAVRVRRSMTSFGGEPSALAISLIGCLSATSTCERATECSQPSTPARAGSPSAGSGGTPSLRSVSSTNSRCAVRDHLPRSVAAALVRDLRRASRCPRRTASRRCSRPSRSAPRRARRRR